MQSNEDSFAGKLQPLSARRAHHTPNRYMLTPSGGKQQRRRCVSTAFSRQMRKTRAFPAFLFYSFFKIDFQG